MMRSPKDGNRRFTFQPQKQSYMVQTQTQATFTINQLMSIPLAVMILIILVFCYLYFDIASHASTYNDYRHKSSNEYNQINQNENSNKKERRRQRKRRNTHKYSQLDPIAITSRSPYMTENLLNISNKNFINLLHRRSLGFDLNEYKLMRDIIKSYGIYHNKIIRSDIKSGILNGSYIIFRTASKFSNKLRSLMGTILLGILTKRVVIVYDCDLFNTYFIHPGFELEYERIPGKLKELLTNNVNNTSIKINRKTFPEEWLDIYDHDSFTSPVVTGSISTQLCNDYNTDDGNDSSLPGNDGAHIWYITSLAAYLPLIARNEKIFRSIIQYYRHNHRSIPKTFDYYIAKHFIKQITLNGQEYIENLEVLFARILFKIKPDIQIQIDNLIHNIYNEAIIYYKNQGLTFPNDYIPPIIGIHIIEEYMITMNPDNYNLNLHEKYKLYEECGVIAMDVNWNKWNRTVLPYLFILGDNISIVDKIFGSKSNRVYFRHHTTANSADSFLIDLITVSSFDIFVATPYSSYSELSSILGQPRRFYSNLKKKYYFQWNLTRNNNIFNRIPVNRMIQPIITNDGYEIDKLNLYSFGRSIDIASLNKTIKILIPSTTATATAKYNKICKQFIIAGMTWNGMFNMFKFIHCYKKRWHHPGNWFPIANK